MTDMSANNKRPRLEYSNGRHVQEEDYGSEQRARKACSPYSSIPYLMIQRDVPGTKKTMSQLIAAGRR